MEHTPRTLMDLMTEYDTGGYDPSRRVGLDAESFLGPLRRRYFNTKMSYTSSNDEGFIHIDQGSTFFKDIDNRPLTPNTIKLYKHVPEYYDGSRLRTPIGTYTSKPPRIDEDWVKYEKQPNNGLYERSSRLATTDIDAEGVPIKTTTIDPNLYYYNSGDKKFHIVLPEDDPDPSQELPLPHPVTTEPSQYLPEHSSTVEPVSTEASIDVRDILKGLDV